MFLATGRLFLAAGGVQGHQSRLNGGRSLSGSLGGRGIATPSVGGAASLLRRTAVATLLRDLVGTRWRGLMGLAAGRLSFAAFVAWGAAVRSREGNSSEKEQGEN